jgi:predicted CXXCH cytochrome family protein
MNVKCVVCHGSPEENFVAKPALNRCRGCHGEMVADVEKKLPAKQRTCFLCHEHHTVAVKEAAAKEKSGFHREGGAQK